MPLGLAHIVPSFNKNIKKQMKNAARQGGAQLVGIGSKALKKAVRQGIAESGYGNPILEKKLDRLIDQGSARAQRKIRGRGAYGLGVTGNGSYGLGVSGNGSYILEGKTYKTNSLFNMSPRQSVTSARDETDSLTVCKDKEWVMDVVLPATPEDFIVVSLAINFGLRGVFFFFLASLLLIIWVMTLFNLSLSMSLL
jgi:hypothetical protein